MNKDSLSLTIFNDTRRECDKHLRYLRSALRGLKPVLPLTGDRYQSLDEAEIKELDQFIFRFTKLQDAMGIRLFPAILNILQEPYEDLSMLDRLNRLEKLNLLASVTEWEQIRELRNRLTHEYPDDPEKNAQTVNLGVEMVQRLETILHKIDDELLKKDIPVRV